MLSFLQRGTNNILAVARVLTVGEEDDSEFFKAHVGLDKVLDPVENFLKVSGASSSHVFYVCCVRLQIVALVSVNLRVV